MSHELKPTEEQVAIIDAATTTNDNLLISALAGAAKTSTLVMIANALPSTNMLCLAFNKRIAVEMQERLPANCKAQTLNSLGHQVWGQALGKRLIVDSKKNYNILKQLIDELPRNQRDEAFDTFADTLKAIGLGKSSGYVPDGKFENSKPLLNDEGMYALLDEEPTKLQFELIRQASFISMKQAWQGTIDFDDQILMPAINPVSFPTFPLTLLDETQDLSVLNHRMVEKIVRQRRLMAVGDDCQSIYAFRGAHPGSMALLKKQFNMRELVLSVSFRCPENIVREAQWRAPHMKWFKSGGYVRRLAKWSIGELPEKTIIVCRNNAPLFKMAVAFLKAGRYAEVVGNDIGKSIVRTLKKLGAPNLPQDEVFKEIEKWRTIKLSKSRSPGSVEDQAECLRIFAEQGATLQDAVAYADEVVNRQGKLLLMTVHKAKGLEWDHVVILDEHLIRKGNQQEDNLLYVAQTRTKDTLWYANSEDWTHA